MSVLFELHEHIPFFCTGAHANKRTTHITNTFRFCSPRIPPDPGLIPSTYRGKLSLNDKETGSRYAARFKLNPVNPSVQSVRLWLRTGRTADGDGCRGRTVGMASVLMLARDGLWGRQVSQVAQYTNQNEIPA